MLHPDSAACHAQEAIISGFFKQPAPSALPANEEVPGKELPEEPVLGNAEPAARMDAILGTALEVANGMSYLHARSIVHGDLTGSNVLLQECQVCALLHARLSLQHHA